MPVIKPPPLVIPRRRGLVIPGPRVPPVRRCPRCRKPIRPRSRCVPRWRRGLAALGMGLAYDSTTGGLLYGADGLLMDGCCCEGETLPTLTRCYSTSGVTGLGLRAIDNVDGAVSGDVVKYRGACYTVGADATTTPTSKAAHKIAGGCLDQACIHCIGCPPIGAATIDVPQMTVSFSGVSLCNGACHADPTSTYATYIDDGTFSGTWCAEFDYSIGTSSNGECGWILETSMPFSATYYAPPGICTGGGGGTVAAYDLLTIVVIRSIFSGVYDWEVLAHMDVAAIPGSRWTLFDGGTSGDADVDCRVGGSFSNIQTICDFGPFSANWIAHGGSSTIAAGC